jgi:hypothetical protein
MIHEMLDRSWLQPVSQVALASPVAQGGVRVALRLFLPHAEPSKITALFDNDPQKFLLPESHAIGAGLLQIKFDGRIANR